MKPLFKVDHVGTSYGEGTGNTTVLIGTAYDLDALKEGVMLIDASTPMQLTYDAFSKANLARCLKWHPQGIESWSDSDWMTAILGELGELASLIKMRNRERDGLSGNKFSPTDAQIAKEAADVYTYLDLFCQRNKINLGLAAAEKFNEVSERVGFPDRIEISAFNPNAGSSIVEDVKLDDVVSAAPQAGRCGHVKADADCPACPPAPQAEPVREYTMGDWFRDLDNPHGNRAAPQTKSPMDIDDVAKAPPMNVTGRVRGVPQPTAEQVREACARVCEQIGHGQPEWTASVGEVCAEEIRAMDLSKIAGG